MEQYRALLRRHLGGESPPRGAIARFAARTGIGDSVISRWLSDSPRRPSPENLAKAAPVLGVSYEDLMAMVYSAEQSPPPPSPDPTTTSDRLLRVAEALIQAAQELQAVAARPSVSVANRNANGEVAGSGDYVRQDRLVPITRIRSTKTFLNQPVTQLYGQAA